MKANHWNAINAASRLIEAQVTPAMRIARVCAGENAPSVSDSGIPSPRAISW